MEGESTMNRARSSAGSLQKSHSTFPKETRRDGRAPARPRCRFEQRQARALEPYSVPWTGGSWTAGARDGQSLCNNL